MTKSAAAMGIAFETKHEAGGTYILIPMESGGEKLKMLLDTGIGDLMLFRCRLRGSLAQLRVRGQDFYVNAGGYDSVAEVEMQAVNVGPIFRRKQKAYVWTAAEHDLRSFDGLLGPAAFGAIVVAFDFDQHVISFETR